EPDGGGTLVKRTDLYQAVTALALFIAALPGCGTTDKCPPSFCDPKPGCTEIPACSRNRVYVFLLDAVDPLSCMGELREALIAEGFIKVYCGPRPWGWHYAHEIRRLHREDEDAHFVIVAQGSANATARWIAKKADVPIDLIVFLDETGEGPACAQRVVFVCG